MAVVMAAVMVAVVKRDEEKQVFDTRERERESTIIAGARYHGSRIESSERLSAHYDQLGVNDKCLGHGAVASVESRKRSRL